jgi:hypothetical protein
MHQVTLHKNRRNKHAMPVPSEQPLQQVPASLAQFASCRALVLDSSYRPIDVINWQRAICLDLFDKVRQQISPSRALQTFRVMLTRRRLLACAPGIVLLAWQRDPTVLTSFCVLALPWQPGAIVLTDSARAGGCAGVFRGCGGAQCSDIPHDTSSVPRPVLREGGHCQHWRLMQSSSVAMTAAPAQLQEAVM